MSKKKKTRVELRYYEIPQNQPILALLGDSWKRNYGNDVDFLHFHNLLEIGYCHYGKGIMEMYNGTTYPYSAGTFTVIPRNLPHNTVSESADAIDYWEYLFIQDDNFLKQFYGSDKLYLHKLISRINEKAHVLQECEYPNMVDTIKAAICELSQPQEFTKEIVQGLVLQLLMQIARLNPTDIAGGSSLQKVKNQISPAFDYLHEHYAEQIKIQTLADVCGMSETHFRRLFEDAINMMPVDYVNLVRIQKACELMRNTNDSMVSIALKTGFLTQSTFNRTFLKIVGIQPFKWKHQTNNCYANTVNYRISAHEGWK